MENRKLSIEAIVGIIAGIVVVLVLFYAFGKKRELAAIETQKQAEIAYVDSLQGVIGLVNARYTDSISILKVEIDTLKNEITRAQSKQDRMQGYEKLDRLVQQSRMLIEANAAELQRIQNEPRQSEYTPQFFADLIEALIENIQLKQQRINELEAEISLLRSELENQKSLTNIATNKAQLAQLEADRKAKEAAEKARLLNESEAAKSKLMVFHYILGSQKQLLKEEVLDRKFLGKERYPSNTIPANRFKAVQLKNDVQRVVLGQVPVDKVFCVPELTGATFQVEQGQLVLHITNFELISGGRFVFYY